MSTAPAHPARTLGTYLPTLDGWRALAIGLVLLAHGSESMQLVFQSDWLAHSATFKKLGLLGVQLFFGLSGFLITSKLIEEENRRGQVSLRSFYIRRAFRILPASVFFLAVVGVLAINGVLDVSLGRWLSTLLFAANYTQAEHSWYLGHFWSLAVEEHFYFLWPAAFLLLKMARRRLALVLAMALLIALWRALDFRFQISGSSPAVFWGRTDIQADGILWGVLTALLYGDAVFKKRLQQWYAHPLGWPVLLAALLLIEALPSGNWKLDFPLISLKALLIPLLILGTVVQDKRFTSRLLESAPLRLVGRLSYSLYLWQQLFLVWSDERVAGLAWVQVFPYNLIAVFVCASLSLLLIENPLIALGHRLAQRQTKLKTSRV
jgi:peptidoglycan/LPS O-acetylase OafA/YrhL